MSIKQIDSHVEGKKGLSKRIDAGASRLVYDILQNTQYAYPVQSTVRELSTNAWDAQREKEVAIEILTGKKKVEDYYIQRDGEQYAASNFDPSYYDLSHFSPESEVLIRHTYNNGTGFCDRFEIIDRGVGLRLDRLINMLSLGYSTKRNTSEGFGAYGLGAKVAFSTGVPSYMIETVHNGKLYRCTCYPYSTSFTVPRFNDDGSENPSESYTDPEGNVHTVHYRRVSAKNGTKVSFLTKRHNRVQFKDAVMEQLMYVSGIRFKIIHENGTEEDLVPRQEIIHSSETLIVSEEQTYGVPHIVVVKSVNDKAGICYGAVDFRELEMEQLYGSVGFKCPIKQSYRQEDGTEVVITDGISVTPSREKVIWNDETKAYILKVIRKAEEEASRLLTQMVSEDNGSITDWLNTCFEITESTRRGSDTLAGRLAGIVDRSAFNLSHPNHPITFNLKDDLLDLFGYIQVEKVTVDYKGAVQVQDVNNLYLRWDHVFEKDSNYSKVKNMYLCKGQGMGTIVTWREYEPDHTETLHPKCGKRLERTELLVSLLRSDPNIRKYSEVIVPEDYEKETLKALDKVEFDNLSPADRRKLENREVAFVPVSHSSWRHAGKFTMKKIQPKAKELLNPKHPTYWFLQSEREDVEKLLNLIKGDLDKVNFSAIFCHEWKPEKTYDFNPPENAEWPINFVQVRQGLSELPHGDNFMHWTNMLYQREGSVITVHPLVQRAYTRLKLDADQRFYDLEFLQWFKAYGPDAFEVYQEIHEFLDRGTTYDGFKDVLKPLDRLDEFHAKVSEIEDEDERKLLSLRTFGFTDVTDSVPLDYAMVERYEHITSFFDPVRKVLYRLRQFLNEQDIASEALRYMSLHGRERWDPGTSSTEN